MRRKLLLLLCLAPWIAPLPGATLERLSIDDLIAKSSDIVRAKVLGSYGEFRGDTIYTHWKLQLVDRWKGVGQAAEVLVPGGTAGGQHQAVSGAPQLAAGGEYLLFLWKSKSGLTFLTGWQQGIFRLNRNPSGELTARREAAGETMLDVSGAAVDDRGIEMSYQEMTRKIQRGSR